MSSKPFEFGKVPDFEEHLVQSIPGYRTIQDYAVELGERFIQSNSCVLDIGCSTGWVLQRLRTEYAQNSPGVLWAGIEQDVGFQSQHTEDIVVWYDILENVTIPNDVSFCLSLFTLQFVRPADKVRKLSELRDKMLPQSGLVIGEKFHAKDGAINSYMDGLYYDYKRQSFAANDIFDKEKQLRPVMLCQTTNEFEQMLTEAGFRNFEMIYKNLQFGLYLIRN